MGRSSLDRQVDEVAQILREVIQLKPRLKTVLPEDLAQLKERLASLSPESAAGRAADYDLFYRASSALYQKKAMTMGQLSETLSIPLSTATRIVNWLVESGYAERFRHPQDRRVVRVALTEVGQQLFQEIDSFVKQRIEAILSQMTPEERESLVPILRKLVQILKKTI